MVDDDVWFEYVLRGVPFELASVRRFETEHGLQFPSSYVRFVSSKMGMALEGGAVMVDGDERSAGYVFGFIGDDGTDDVHVVPYRHRLLVGKGFRDSLVPIMGGFGGEIVFDFTAGPTGPSVAYVEPESDGEEAVMFLAADFDTFLADSLQPDS